MNLHEISVRSQLTFRRFTFKFSTILRQAQCMQLPLKNMLNSKAKNAYFLHEDSPELQILYPNE